MNRWSSMKEMHGCPGGPRATELNDWRRSSRNVFYWCFHVPRWAWPVECKCWNLPMPTWLLRSFRGRQVNCTVLINLHAHPEATVTLHLNAHRYQRLGLPQTSESIECRHVVSTDFSPYLLIFAPYLFDLNKFDTDVLLDPICPTICCTWDVYQDTIKRYGGPTAPSAPWPQDLNHGMRWWGPTLWSLEPQAPNATEIGKLSDFKIEIFDHHSIVWNETNFQSLLI